MGAFAVCFAVIRGPGTSGRPPAAVLEGFVLEGFALADGLVVLADGGGSDAGEVAGATVTRVLAPDGSGVAEQPARVNATTAATPRTSLDILVSPHEWAKR